MVKIDVKSLLNELDVVFYLRPYGYDDSQLFLLVEDWDSVKKINMRIKEEFMSMNLDIDDHEIIDMYDTYYIDEVVDRWGFTDEYYLCDGCDKIYPIEEKFKSNRFIDYEEGMQYCPNCVKANPRGYIDYLLEFPDERANMFLSERELNSLGFEKLNDKNYESGYYGRTDDPKQIYRRLKEEHPDADILFHVSGSNPFEVDFDVFIREDK